MKQWKRWFSVASAILVVLLIIAGAATYKHYKDYPGRVERDSIRVADRGADFIILNWDETANTDVYSVFIKEHAAVIEDSSADPPEDGSDDPEDELRMIEETVTPDESWRLVETDKPELTVDGLEEDTLYSFIIRADNAKHESIATEPRSFSTKMTQDIEVERRITKLSSSKPFRLDAEAETPLMFESSDTSVAEVIDRTKEIRINGPGTAEITVRATETRDYEGDTEKVKLQVIEAEPVDAGGASARIIYHLDADNCEIVKSVTGSGGASVPQGLAYTGDKYIISYGMGSPNRIISFDVDGDGKDVYVPRVSLGHPNGFTYANENGLCYCVKGWSSKAVTWSVKDDDYSSVNLRYGCSGIGYDRKEKLLYTCSRTAMVAYDISDGYSVKYRTGVVKHSGHVYTQDCGGHAGILLRCLSGSRKHGINYIDLYDMKHGKYLGTFSCDLSEVESCIVNDDGFLEILANNTSGTDYIWRTKINIETIGEGL